MAILRGEIYFVNLNPVTGREQGGSRPVLVLSRFPDQAAGKLSDAYMTRIEEAVQFCLDM